MANSVLNAVGQKNIWTELSPPERDNVMIFAEDYKLFLNKGKTERESVELAVNYARSKGFRSLEEFKGIKPGDKVYTVNRGKSLVLAVVGSEPLEAGINIVGAHVDAPRIDLKPQPLYEDNGLALFKTHYYGGIKKYHWVGIPLALHGVVVKGSGEKINIVIGEKGGEPLFTITDLLPHLAKDQMEKKLSEAITGEGLNVLVGGIPLKDDDIKDKVKQTVLTYLKETYGLEEEDFISAELELVPAWPAADIGFDRSMLGGYGQDDRVCSYTALRAVCEINQPRRTAAVILADKEEIGSAGNTGMQAVFFQNFVAELAVRTMSNYNDLALRRILANSRALSADVNAALDPNYKEVMDKLNASRLGNGIVITKYTGSRGKSGANDAHAEFVGHVRRLFNKEKVVWQSGELGKVDQGGGGTIAYLMAAYGMDVLDCGIALLGMHSTFEVASKADIYMAYRAYLAFLKE